MLPLRNTGKKNRKKKKRERKSITCLPPGSHVATWVGTRWLFTWVGTRWMSCSVARHETRAKETAREENWSRNPKKGTDVSDAETEKEKEGLSEIARCYLS